MAENTATPEVGSSKTSRHEDRSGDDSNDDLTSITHLLTLDFNLRVDWFPRWTPRRGFHELVRNW